MPASIVRSVRPQLLNQYEEFAEWLFSKGNRELLSHDEIADKIYDLRVAKRKFNGAKIPRTNAQTIGSWIAQARIHLRQSRRVVVWNVPTKGWRIGTDHECAVYGLTWLRRLVETAKTTKEYAEIIKAGSVERAVREVFPDAKGGIVRLLKDTQDFKIVWDTIRKEQRDEARKALLVAKT